MNIPYEWEVGIFDRLFGQDNIFYEEPLIRPVTTLFLLSSLDGKISTGSTDNMDVDKDFPNIDGLKEGLRQYYDIEQTTDLWSMCSGRVQAKVGANSNPIPKNNNPVVSFAIVDNSHLTEHGVEYLAAKTKKLVIITKNKKHPAVSVIQKMGSDSNISIIHGDMTHPDEIMSALYTDFGCKRLTVQTGSELNALLFKNKCIDYVDLVIAPAIIGGIETASVMGGKSFTSVADLQKITVLELMHITRLKNSYVRMTYKVKK